MNKFISDFAYLLRALSISMSAASKYSSAAISLTTWLYLMLLLEINYKINHCVHRLCDNDNVWFLLLNRATIAHNNDYLITSSDETAPWRPVRLAFVPFRWILLRYVTNSSVGKLDRLCFVTLFIGGNRTWILIML